MKIEKIYKIYRQYPSIQTDTRKLKKGDLFLALKGPNFNGNLFAEQALEKGAAYVFTDEKISFNHDRIIQTNDTLETLQQLAKFHRQQFNIPFIAITGSNGKTTTKELAHEVLSAKYKTYTTAGNLNNHIGIPLTILKIKLEAEMAIVEMGANHLKEIAGYCEYAMPTHGLITNIGKAHDEGFLNIRQKINEKLKLFLHSEIIILCRDYLDINECLMTAKAQMKKADPDFDGLKTFSWSKNNLDADVQVRKIEKNSAFTNLTLEQKKETFLFTIPFIDDASIENAVHCCKPPYNKYF